MIGDDLNVRYFRDCSAVAGFRFFWQNKIAFHDNSELFFDALPMDK